MKPALTFLVLLTLVLGGSQAVNSQQPPSGGADGFHFRTGVELINVTATVTDSNGRFVSGLRKEDFVVYEDEEVQTVTHFSNDRVPVSLGIVLDTSGSMVGGKLQAALTALDRFLYDLLDPADEIFIYRFSNYPYLVQEWTTDREELRRALGRIRAEGGTALYDAVAEATPLAQTGDHRKKALVVISDGNDTNSRTHVRDLKRLIRETEVLVYAIGIDGRGNPTMTGRPRWPVPIPTPAPGRRWPFPWLKMQRGGWQIGGPADYRVNVGALRDLTDDSGGRTEIIRTAYDLDPATASIADELSQQYYLAYPSRGLKDGRWHTIRVEVREGNHRVRARRGYVATPY